MRYIYAVSIGVLIVLFAVTGCGRKGEPIPPEKVTGNIGFISFIGFIGWIGLTNKTNKTNKTDCCILIFNF